MRLPPSPRATLPSILVWALVPGVALAQMPDEADIEGTKSSYEQGHDALKTIFKRIASTPFKNPLTGKLADLAAETVYDEVQRRWLDPAHARDVLRQYREPYYEAKSVAIEEERAVRAELELTESLFELETDPAILDSLLQKKARLQRRAADLDRAIEVIDQRLENADRAQAHVDRGGGIPPGFSSLAKDFDRDFGPDAERTTDLDGSMTCAELEAEQRRLEEEIRQKYVGKVDVSLVPRIQADAALLERLKQLRKDCRD